MGSSVEYISYNCVLLSYSQGPRRAVALRGKFLPLFFQKGSNRGGANFSSQHHKGFHGLQDLVETNFL